jgi:hypothetical protein
MRTRNRYLRFWILHFGWVERYIDRRLGKRAIHAPVVRIAKGSKEVLACLGFGVNSRNFHPSTTVFLMQDAEYFPS